MSCPQSWLSSYPYIHGIYMPITNTSGLRCNGAITSSYVRIDFNSVDNHILSVLRYTGLPGNQSNCINIGIQNKELWVPRKRLYVGIAEMVLIDCCLDTGDLSIILQNTQLNLRWRNLIRDLQDIAVVSDRQREWDLQYSVASAWSERGFQVINCTQVTRILL